jgi:hypothetical protein
MAVCDFLSGAPVCNGSDTKRAAVQRCGVMSV